MSKEAQVSSHPCAELNKHFAYKGYFLSSDGLDWMEVLATAWQSSNG